MESTSGQFYNTCKPKAEFCRSKMFVQRIFTDKLFCSLPTTSILDIWILDLVCVLFLWKTNLLPCTLCIAVGTLVAELILHKKEDEAEYLSLHIFQAKLPCLHWYCCFWAGQCETCVPSFSLTKAYNLFSFQYNDWLSDMALPMHTMPSLFSDEWTTKLWNLVLGFRSSQNVLDLFELSGDKNFT